VKPTGLLSEPLIFQVFCNGRGKGDHIVLNFGFDFLDAGHGEGALGGDGLCSVSGDDAVFGQNRAGSGLDLEPAAVFGFFGPDAAHGGAGIAVDQRWTPWGCR
jgi:hypothetical protein